MNRTHSLFCEKSWPSANGPFCCFRGVKTLRYSCTWRSGVRTPATPFPVLHIDTGQNFIEVLEFRDRAAAAAGARLLVAKVQDSIDQGKVVIRVPLGSRNRLQTVTLLDAITEYKFDAPLAVRDATRIRRARRNASSASVTLSVSGTRVNNAPNCGSSIRGKVNPGESVRAFPLSDWTELDVWQYIEREKMDLPSIYFAHERDVIMRDGMWLAVWRVRRTIRERARRAQDHSLSHGRRRELHRRGYFERAHLERHH